MDTNEPVVLREGAPFRRSGVLYKPAWVKVKAGEVVVSPQDGKRYRAKVDTERFIVRASPAKDEAGNDLPDEGDVATECYGSHPHWNLAAQDAWEVDA